MLSLPSVSLTRNRCPIKNSWLRSLRMFKTRARRAFLRISLPASIIIFGKVSKKSKTGGGFIFIRRSGAVIRAGLIADRRRARKGQRYQAIGRLFSKRCVHMWQKIMSAAINWNCWEKALFCCDWEIIIEVSQKFSL